MVPHMHYNKWNHSLAKMVLIPPCCPSIHQFGYTTNFIFHYNVVVNIIQGIPMNIIDFICTII